MSLGRLISMMLVCAALCPGCGDDTSAASVGDGDGDGDGAGDGDGDGDSTTVELIPCTGSVCFPEVYEAILFNIDAYRCADSFCHGVGQGELYIFDQQSAYEALVTVPAAGAAAGPNKPACSDSGLKRVEPGNAAASLLFVKVSETMPACGDPMPQDPALALSQEHIELLRTWIDEGAGYE